MQRPGALGPRQTLRLTLLSASTTLALWGSLSCGQTGTPSAPPTLPAPSAGLSISPSSAVLYAGSVTTFTAKMPDGAAANVTWTLATEGGSSYPPGLISSSGAYQAPSPVLSAQAVSVQATLVSNTASKATASITLNPLANQEGQTIPIAAGTSVSNAVTGGQCCAGTAGAIIADESGRLYLLSNNHVIARTGAAQTGESILQPGNLDTLCTGQGQTPVASLTYAPPLSSSNVDTAIAAALPGAVRTDGAIIGLGAPDSNGNATLGSPASTPMTAVPGEGVAKSGRGSGLTCGTITAIETTVTVNFPLSCGATQAQSVAFQNQIVLSGGLVKDGDSGSLLVDQGSARPLGVVAGLSGDGTYATANPIVDVFSALAQGTGHTFNMVGGPDHKVACGNSTQELSQLVSAVSSESRRPLLDARRSVERQHLANPHVLGIGLGREDGTAAEPDEIIVFVDSKESVGGIEDSAQGYRIRKIITRPFTVPSSAAKSCKQPRFR
jgi:hypothetical protein